MEKKFNIGDYVRMKHFPYEGKIRRITGIEGNAYWVDGLTLCTEAHFEPISAKNAFLSELKGLLAKHGVSIMLDAKGSYCGDDVESVTMSFCFNNEHIDYTITDFDKEITADNIMDYEKK